MTTLVITATVADSRGIVAEASVTVDVTGPQEPAAGEPARM